MCGGSEEYLAKAACIEQASDLRATVLQRGSVALAHGSWASCSA